MRKVVFVSNMSEVGAGTRGSSLGFLALEMAAHRFGKRLFSQVECYDIQVNNDSLYDAITTPFAKHIDAITDSTIKAAGQISKVLREGLFPFVISGDHSNAVATILGIRRAFPGKRLGVVWMDAHGDLHSPYTTPSGNMHGMPLAILLAEDNKEKKRNDVDIATVRKWNALKKVGGDGQKIRSSDIVLFSVRDTESPEDHLISKLGIRNFRVEELRYKGIESCVASCLHILRKCDLIYLSFDVDSMDCNIVSNGTGTPVPEGLRPEEAQEILLAFMKDPRLICVETVEINPLLDDKGNKMAEETVRIIDNLFRMYCEK